MSLYSPPLLFIPPLEIFPVLFMEVICGGEKGRGVLNRKRKWRRVAIEGGLRFGRAIIT